MQSATLRSTRTSGSCALRAASARALLLGASLLGACDPPPPTRPARRDVATTPGPTTGTPPVSEGPRCGSPGASGARVVIDVSRSMQGFASDRTTTLEKVHTALDLALGDANIAPPLRRCTLGDELDCDTARTRQDFNVAGLYTAGNCRLDRALRAPPVIDPRNPPTDPIDPYRAVVILTDGMQSASPGANADDDPIAACNSGADPNCVRLLLRDRIRQGYGLWFVQFFLPFNGRHFAEQGLDAATYETIKAHVSEACLRLPYSAPEPGLPSRGHHGRQAEPPLHIGSHFEVHDRLASYEYRGWKPLMAWILSCDERTGEQLVERFRAQLVAQGVVGSDDRRFFSQRVAPMAGQERHFGPLSRVGEVAGRVDLLRPTRGANPSSTVQRVVCDTEGRATLRIPIVTGQRTFNNPDFVTDPLSLGFVGRTLSRDALSTPRPDGDGLLRTLRCERFPAGVHRETMVIGSSLALGELPADAWWREFDAPTSYSMPERVFGLRPLVDGLLAVGAERRFVWDTFTIEIERQ